MREVRMSGSVVGSGNPPPTLPVFLKDSVTRLNSFTGIGLTSTPGGQAEVWATFYQLAQANRQRLSSALNSPIKLLLKPKE